MPKAANRSHVNSNRQAFYKHAGRYNEVTKDASGRIKNDASSALDQKDLAPAGNQSAAAITLRNVEEELGL